MKFIDGFYHGDGIYGDGRNFAMDYYNSFVIHPMLTDIIMIGAKHELRDFKKFVTVQIPRLQRYACIQERMVSPEGAYPVIGRTLICRIGAFHALAEAVWLEMLPENLSTGQVRCAMTALLKRQFEGNSNFGNNDFLVIGFNGTQKEFAEHYVSSGSPYHCTTFFLPLGLSPESDFWKSPAEKWTSLKAFTGDEFEADHAYKDANTLMPTIYFWYISLSAKRKAALCTAIALCLVFNLLGMYCLYKQIKDKI